MSGTDGAGEREISPESAPPVAESPGADADTRDDYDPEAPRPALGSFLTLGQTDGAPPRVCRPDGTCD